WAPKACWYQSAACAAPSTTRCGVMVWVVDELARSVSWFIDSSAQSHGHGATDQHTHTGIVRPCQPTAAPSSITPTRARSSSVTSSADPGRARPCDTQHDDEHEPEHDQSNAVTKAPSPRAEPGHATTSVK